jgi:hypothetical protein
VDDRLEPIGRFARLVDDRLEPIGRTPQGSRELPAAKGRRRAPACGARGLHRRFGQGGTSQIMRRLASKLSGNQQHCINLRFLDRFSTGSIQ